MKGKGRVDIMNKTNMDYYRESMAEAAMWRYFWKRTGESRIKELMYGAYKHALDWKWHNA